MPQAVRGRIHRPDKPAAVESLQAIPVCKAGQGDHRPGEMQLGASAIGAFMSWKG